MAEAIGAVPSASVDVGMPTTLFKKRGAGAGSNMRKKKITPPFEDEENSYDSASDHEADHGFKRRKTGAGIVSASSANNINKSTTNIKLSASTLAADRSAAISSLNDATKQSDWFDERDEKSWQGKTPAATPNRTYKDLAHQTSFIQKNPNAPTSKSIGPQKTSTNVRITTLTDYAPDVCKDWKQTGYCGFGDSCKFLHERSDYKQGWQLDSEWETVTKGKNFKGTVVSNANLKRRRMEGNDKEEEEEEDEEAMLQNIPFKCLICKGDYKSPVVTRCGHYFCEACALNRYKKEPSCAACGKGTGGIFNNAKKLKRLLERKREREERRAMEGGEREGEGQE